MYAVIKTGGKQYRVEEGQRLCVETLPVKEGEIYTFDEVLMVHDGDATVGTPLVEGAKVVAKSLGNGRAKKVKIIKFKRRKHHMKQMGHRQDYTELLIESISKS